MGWLSLPFLGIPRGFWLFGALVLVIVGGVLALARVQHNNNQAQQTIGATQEQKKVDEQVIKNVETGNAARQEITQPNPTGDKLRYDQCVRSSRTPANCRRFLPQ